MCGTVADYNDSMCKNLYVYGCLGEGVVEEAATCNLSVPVGLFEVSKSLDCQKNQTTAVIIIPQCKKRLLPALKST